MINFSIGRYDYTINYLDPVPDETKVLCRSAAYSFGHLLELGDLYTAPEFADIIIEHYDESNPKTAAVVKALREA